MQFTFVLLSDSAKEARMGGREKLRKKGEGLPHAVSKACTRVQPLASWFLIYPLLPQATEVQV